MSGFGFKVDPLAMAAHGKRMEAEASRGGKRYRDYENFPNGQSRWRLLPPWSQDAANKQLCCVAVRKHFFRGSLGLLKVVKCLTQADNQRQCPVCQVIEKYNVPYDPKMSKEERARVDNGVWRFRAGETYIFNAIKRGMLPGEADKVCLLQTGKDFVTWVYKLFEVGQDPLDPDAGIDLTAFVADKGNNQKARQFLPADRRPAVPAGAEPPQLSDLSRELGITDEDIKRATDAADGLAKLMRSRRAEASPDLNDHPRQAQTEAAHAAPIVTAADALMVGSSEPAASATYPRGWRISKTGEIRSPKLDEASGKPVCFGDWFSKLRKNDPTQDRATDQQCSICAHEMTCRDRATQRRAEKAVAAGKVT